MGIKGSLKRIDHKLLGDHIQKAYRWSAMNYDHIVNPGAYDKFFLQAKSFIVCTELETIELIKAQFEGTEFTAFDTVVRLLAVEDFYGLNDFGFSLYKKMQVHRGSYESHNENRFIDLIKSFEDKGYDASSKIETDKKLRLYDGSHRLALAIYYDIRKVAVQMSYTDHGNRNFGLKWFIDNEFSEIEISRIRNRFEQLGVEGEHIK